MLFICCSSRNSLCVSKWVKMDHFFFYWSLITLWCCVSFCCKSRCISHMYTYIPSSWTPSPRPRPPPLGHHRALRWAPRVAQQPPTSHLAYTEQCCPPFVPPPPPPSVSTGFFSTSASLFLPWNRSICTIVLDSIYVPWYMIFVFLVLTYFTLYDRHMEHSNPALTF